MSVIIIFVTSLRVTCLLSSHSFFFKDVSLYFQKFDEDMSSVFITHGGLLSFLALWVVLYQVWEQTAVISFSILLPILSVCSFWAPIRMLDQPFAVLPQDFSSSWFRKWIVSTDLFSHSSSSSSCVVLSEA